MCTRANALLAVLVTVALLATDDVVERLAGTSIAPTRVHPRPMTWRDKPVVSYEQPITDGRMAMLRFDPDLPATTAYTVEHVVEGDPARIIVYVPWVHDHPNAPPMPEAYLASLRDVLIALSRDAAVVGVEGNSVTDDLREEFALVEEVLWADGGAVESSSILEGYLLDRFVEVFPSIYRQGTDRLLHSVAAATFTLVVGVEDPTFAVELTIRATPGVLDWCKTYFTSIIDGTAPPAYISEDSKLLKEVVEREESCAKFSDPSCGPYPPHSPRRIRAIAQLIMREEARIREEYCGVFRTGFKWHDDATRDRLRSEAAVCNILDALDVRGGGRAILLFGMAHHHDIEEAARRAGVTLDLVCMPHLCEVAAEVDTVTPSLH